MAVVSDKTKSQPRIQVDCISLLWPGTDKWDYYAERDIQNSSIVFFGVDTLKMHPENIEPNDFMNDIVDEQDADLDGRYRGTISIDSADPKGGGKRSQYFNQIPGGAPRRCQMPADNT